VSYSGEFFSLDKAHLSLSTLQKYPPIYIGSFSSKETLRIVGEMADGWYPGSQFTPEVFRQNVQIIHDAASGSRRSFETIDVMASIPTFVCSDKNQIPEIKRKIKGALKRKLLLNQHLWKGFGLDRSKFTFPRELEYQFATPGQQYDKALASAAESLAIPDEILEGIIEETIALGTADECISTIEKYLDAGATHIFFSSMLGTRENYRLIAQEIVPRLRGK
ncbi:MAG: LLM class flavin-dependent oxidoreductase, partial [Nitrososphaerales archaeon]